MRSFLIPLLLTTATLWAADALTGSSAPDVTVTLQTGLSDTFQLTLGGVYGQGPAWQNRIVVSSPNIFRGGDLLSISGFSTTDLQSGIHDWSGAVSYKARLLRHNTQQLSLGASFERWRFPLVLSGAQDWVAGYNATYSRTVLGVPLTVQSNAWTLLHSPLPKGSLVHTTAWLSHPLGESKHIAITFRHGPQHTYSWGLYGTHGHRILRYAGTLTFARGSTSLELGYRQQLGLQPRIPDNRLWHVMLSQTF